MIPEYRNLSLRQTTFALLSHSTFWKSKVNISFQLPGWVAQKSKQDDLDTFYDFVLVLMLKVVFELSIRTFVSKLSVNLS